MDKVLRYFSFSGRANRQRYWMTALLIGVFYVIGMMLTLGLGDIVHALAFLFIPVLLLFIAAVLANCARRLHDRNKSTWWLLIFTGVPAFFSLLGVLGAAGGGPADAANFIGALGLPFTIWGFVEMGCLRGTTGPNKYGDDPLATPPEAIAGDAAAEPL